MANPDEQSAPAPLAETTPVSDPDALGRLSNWGGEKLVTEMVGLFLSQAPERIWALRAGIRDHAPLEVERAAHALKSSSGQVGALRVQALCATIEARAAGGDLAGAPDLLASLERELGRYQQEAPTTVP